MLRAVINLADLGSAEELPSLKQGVIKQKAFCYTVGQSLEFGEWLEDLEHRLLESATDQVVVMMDHASGEPLLKVLPKQSMLDLLGTIRTSELKVKLYLA